MKLSLTIFSWLLSAGIAFAQSTVVGGAGQTTVAATQATVVAASPAGGTPALTWQSGAIDGTDLTTYTFSGLAIGEAAARDHVVVGVLYRATSNNIGASSVTIGGVTATLIAEHKGNDSANSTGIGFYYAVVPTGTTTDVVLTLSAGCIRAACSVWTVTDVGSFTPVDSATSAFTSSNANMTLISTSPTGTSVAFAMAIAAVNGIGWTGATENTDGSGGESVSISSASTSYSSSGDQTITADPVNGSAFLQGGLMIILQ